MAACLVAGWAASLTLPAATTDHLNAPQHFDGLEILALGWLGPLMFQFGWLANPLLGILVFSVVFGGRTIRPGLLHGLSVLMGLLVLNSAFWSGVPDDSGANPISAYGAGYYLWMGVMGGCILWLQLLARARSDPTGATR